MLRPSILLRLEAFIALIACVVAYGVLFPHHWGFFALLLFVPDVALLVYLVNKGAPAAVFYNLVHSSVLPVLLGLGSWMAGGPYGERIALIWLAHIALDRALGFGLKFAGTFSYTHLQSVAAGRSADTEIRD